MLLVDSVLDGREDIVRWWYDRCAHENLYTVFMYFSHSASYVIGPETKHVSAD